MTRVPATVCLHCVTDSGKRRRQEQGTVWLEKKVGRGKGVFTEEAHLEVGLE